MKCNYICKICSKKETGNWVDKVINRMIKKQLCFTCNFWHEIKENEHYFLIIDGTSYQVGPENDSSCFRGFGGRKFEIKTFDGKTITTTNLWTQGEIPEGHWREQLPDNAEFLKPRRTR